MIVNEGIYIGFKLGDKNDLEEVKMMQATNKSHDLIRSQEVALLCRTYLILDNLL